MTDDQMNHKAWQQSEPLWRRLNPCDIARFDWLAPVGDLVARLTPECACCAGFRMIGALVAGLVIGSYL